MVFREEEYVQVSEDLPNPSGALLKLVNSRKVEILIQQTTLFRQFFGYPGAIVSKKNKKMYLLFIGLEAYLKPWQTSKVEHFAKILSGFQPLSIFSKCFPVTNWLYYCWENWTPRQYQYKRLEIIHTLLLKIMVWGIMGRI